MRRFKRLLLIPVEGRSGPRANTTSATWLLLENPKSYGRFLWNNEQVKVRIK